MKIKTMIFVLVGIALFVLVSTGAMSPRKELRAAGLSCPPPNYPCAGLPHGFRGWPQLP